MPNSTQVISFDAGGTLIEPYPSVGHVYARHAQEFGLVADPEDLNARFKAAFRKRLKKPAGKPLDKAFWKIVVADTMANDLPKQDQDEFFDRVFEAFGKAECWRLCNGAETALRMLADKGFRLVILSNNDSRLHGIIRDLGIENFFEKIFISEELGVEKPDPEIFRRVNDILDVEPASVLHVGDSLEADGFGPAAAGWRAVLLEPARDPGGEIPTVSHLPHLLRLV